MRNFDFRRVFIIVILAFMGVMCVMICLHFGDVVKEVPFVDYVANMRFIGAFVTRFER